MTSLATLPGFLTHFLAGIALLSAACWLYMRITPHDELALVRAGNAAAAVALAGAVVGFALPISASVANSANLLDAAVWSLVSLAVQLGGFFLATRLLGPGWRAAIEQRGEVAPALVKAAVAVAIGMINAACLAT